MRVSVDLDLCESHGVCVGFAPDVFELGDDDVTRVLLPEPPAELHDAVRQAVSMCPKQAISVTED
jgi:ferredoxin